MSDYNWLDYTFRDLHLIRFFWISILKYFPCIVVQVSWNDDGDALFHRECWGNLQIAAKIKGDELYLTELEVNLINAAKKTAEYHDPDLFVLHEANRIVQLLRDSEYPVLFTGKTCTLQLCSNNVLSCFCFAISFIN